MNAADVSPTLIAAVGLAALFGALMGRLIRLVATRLPRRLWQQAQYEAALTLGHPAPAMSAPPLPIGSRISATEVATAALTAMLTARFGLSAPLLPALLLAWMLLVLALIDLRTQWLPDALTLPLLWGGLLVNLTGVLTPLPDAVAGAVTGYLVLAGVNLAYRTLRGRNGIGGGDAKLLAALGAWLGWQALPDLLLLASVSGILWAIAMICRRRLQADTPFPFGPFLAGAGVAALWLQRPLWTLAATLQP